MLRTTNSKIENKNRQRKVIQKEPFKTSGELQIKAAMETIQTN